MKQLRMKATRMSGNRISQVPLLMLALFACVPVPLRAQCVSNQDHRSDKARGIVVSHLVLSGTRTVSSAEMAEITSSFAGSCFDENSEEMGERIRDQFQQRGYFQAKVDNVSVKAIDPLATPKPVNVEADVVEGSLYRFSEVQFDGNRVFSAEQLRAQFPTKRGDVFSTQRLRGGLDAVRRLYGSAGYLDFTAVPATQLNSDQTVTLELSITEGTQYRMGKLQIAGQQEQADAIQLRWSLREGVPFDAGYLQKFLQENSSLFPSGFQENDSVRVLRNCRDASVTVSIILDKDSHPRQPAEEIGCDKDAGTPHS